MKSKTLMSVLAGFAFSFTYCFFGAYEIYAGNLSQFYFRFADFALWLALVTIVVFAVITATLLLLRGRAFELAFALVLWLAVMGYVQASFLNVGVNSLLSDDVGSTTPVWFKILDLFIWLATGAGAVFAGLKLRKNEIISTVAVMLLILVSGMQLAGFAGSIASGEVTGYVPGMSQSTSEAESQDGNEEDKAYYVLTEDGLTETTNGKNIIMFIIDRYDIVYNTDLLRFKGEEFFAPLDGFTLYTDNLSLYSRTYPAIATMITGVENDFSGTAEEYFKKAYSESDFISDLQANDYKIKLYTESYYTYRDASVFAGVADNVGLAGDYIIKDRPRLIKSLLLVSLFRSTPNFLKPVFNVSSSSFSQIIEYAEIAPMFVPNDVKVYADMREKGLTVNENGNSYTVIHLNGCHPPYMMDADGNPTEFGEVIGSLMGCMNYIYNYISELKRLGLYEDSTIIITGDHPRAISDSKVPTQSRVTALFVKEAGKSGTPLAVSTAQVSEDNLIATLVKSAGIETEKDYGKAYGEISEGENNPRRYRFQLTNDNSSYILEYSVNGDGSDFENWKLVSETDIGYIYK